MISFNLHAQTQTAQQYEGLIFVSLGDDNNTQDVVFQIEQSLSVNNINTYAGKQALSECVSAYCGFSSLDNMHQALVSQTQASQTLMSQDNRPILNLSVKMTPAYGLSLSLFDPLNSIMLESISLPLPKVELADHENAQKRAHQPETLSRLIADATTLMSRLIKNSQTLRRVNFSLNDFSEPELDTLLSYLSSLEQFSNSATQANISSIALSNNQQTGASTSALSGWTNMSNIQILAALNSIKEQTGFAFQLEQLKQEASLQGIALQTNGSMVASFALTKNNRLPLWTKALTLVLGLLVTYLIAWFVFYQFMHTKMLLLLAENRLHEWMKCYRICLIAPFAVPKTLRQSKHDVLNSLKLFNEFLINTQESIASNDWSGANTALLRAKAIDKSHPEIAPLATLIADHRNALTESSQHIQTLKSLLQKAVSAMQQQHYYQAYYFCFSALSASSHADVQEQKAIHILIDKLEASLLQTHAYAGQDLHIEFVINGKCAVLSTAQNIKFGRPNHTHTQTSDAEVNKASTTNDCLHVVIAHQAVSRLGKQCSISAQQGNIYLSDNGSSNGTYLEGVQVSKGIDKALAPSCRLSMADEQGLSPVTFNISTDVQQQSVTVSLAPSVLLHDSEQLKLSFENYKHLSNTQYCLVGQALYLVMDAKNGLELRHLNQLEPTSKVIARVYHDKAWRVAPQVTEADSDLLLLDQVCLLGAVIINDRVILEYAGWSMILSFGSSHQHIGQMYD